MNMMGKIAGVYVPQYLKKRELKNLFDMTATAFGATTVQTSGLSYERMLDEYARFTSTVISKSVNELHNLGTARQQLCRQAYTVGNNIRERLGVISISDIMTACRIVYRCIGIDFEGTETGEITIRRCFFSKYYSDQACGIISCLDKGLVAGISKGGKLSFVQRITDGSDCCKAQFIPRESVHEIGDRGGYRCWWCDCS